MSARFPLAGETGDTPPMPDMPDMQSIPAGAGAKLPGVRPRGPGPDIDISLFRDPTFNPEKCRRSGFLVAGVVG